MSINALVTWQVIKLYLSRTIGLILLSDRDSKHFLQLFIANRIQVTSIRLSMQLLWNLRAKGA